MPPLPFHEVVKPQVLRGNRYLSPHASRLLQLQVLPMPTPPQAIVASRRMPPARCTYRRGPFLHLHRPPLPVTAFPHETSAPVCAPSSRLYRPRRKYHARASPSHVPTRVLWSLPGPSSSFLLPVAVTHYFRLTPRSTYRPTIRWPRPLAEPILSPIPLSISFSPPCCARRLFRWALLDHPRPFLPSKRTLDRQRTLAWP